MSFWNGTEWVVDAPPDPKRPSRVKRVAAATLEAALVTALTFGLIAGTAFAGKGGNGGGGKPGGGGDTGGSASIALAPIVSDANGNGLPNYGDVVTFNISTSASQPFVNLVCSQGGNTVLVGWKGYFEGSLDTNWNFGLASGAWQGGDASCTAYVKVSTRRGWSTLGSTSFHAGA